MQVASHVPGGLPFLGLSVAAAFARALFGRLPPFADSYAAQVNSHSLYLHLCLLKLLRGGGGDVRHLIILPAAFPSGHISVSLAGPDHLDQGRDSLLFSSLAAPV